jgi:hypothetical protein
MFKWKSPSAKGKNLYFGYIQSVPGGKDNIRGGHSIGHSKKKSLYEHVSYPNGFRYLERSILNLARNIFLPSRRNAPMSAACESV